MLYRLAIVEDNATARATLRSHLLPLGLFEISSFSNGIELKAALRKQNFELILIDYHLGQRKNGVEWVKELRQSRFIKPSTGIIFITADRLPQTIGQIMDLYPDALVIKPYTIGSIGRTLRHYCHFREFVAPVLPNLDNDDPAQALSALQGQIKKGVPAKIRSDILKLQARLTFESGQTDRALALYEKVLARSDKVLWAQWGRVKCLFSNGNWDTCKDKLSSLLATNLARDKAFEWLAGLCFEQQDFSQAEFYLDHIKVSELSAPATKLKTLTYQQQDRVVDALELLQKKRDYNHSTKEKFNEFTFDLAEFYLSIAEQQPPANRHEGIAQARRLIGVAGRSQNDQQLIQKRDFLLAHGAVLEGDHKKAQALLDGDNITSFGRTDTSTLLTAAKVFSALGNTEQARTLLDMAYQRNHNTLDVAERMINQTALETGEISMGLAGDKAGELNESGTQHFIAKDYNAAMGSFYLAHRLVPGTAAFAINLLHSMVEAKQPVYKSCTAKTLLTTLTAMGDIGDNNQARLMQLRQHLEANPELYLPSEPEPEQAPAQEAGPAPQE